MSFRVRSMLCPAGSLVLSGLLAASGCGEKPPAPGAPAAAAAQSVYRDPATGKFGPPPPSAAPMVPAPAQLSSSSAGLREVAGPRGGVMVHLDGRFQNQVTATRGAGGAISTECQPREER